MRRLYFLLPGIEITHKVTDELLLSHVEERHIHVIAADSAELGDLPEASLLQKSDFSKDAFDPAQYDKTLLDFMAQMHVQDNEGFFFLGVDAFPVIWRALPGIFFRLLIRRLNAITRRIHRMF